MLNGPEQAEWSPLFVRSARARHESQRQLELVARELRQLAVSQEAIADSLQTTVAASPPENVQDLHSLARQAREFSASLEASAAFILAMASPGTESVSWTVLPSDVAPAAARSWIRLELSKWGIDSDANGALLLVADELVANAVRHANTVIKVTLVRYRATLTVGVRDHVVTTPYRALNSSIQGAFGLRLIDTLAVQGWWCAPHTGQKPGKTIWAQVSLSRNAAG